MKIEKIKPEEIEKRSFEIITEILGDKKLAPENEKVIKRVIQIRKRIYRSRAMDRKDLPGFK